MQGHFAYAGFAWYRLRFAVAPAPDVKPGFLLLMPSVTDVYQVYWNGVLIGQYGEHPPHAAWLAFSNSHIFGFPADSSGTLAIHVRSAPLRSDASGQAGGLTSAPIISDPDSVNAMLDSRDVYSPRSSLYVLGLSFLPFHLRLLPL